MNKKVELSIITPTYQNEIYIKEVVEEIYKDIINLSELNCEFIIYESGSTDKTRQILIKLQKQFPFKLIKTPQRVGYISQVKKLYQEAKGEIIFFLDSDGECPPKNFWQLYRQFQKNKFDIVTALRKNRKPFYRSFITQTNNFLIRVLFNSKVHDANCAFRLIKAEVAGELTKNSGFLRHNFNSEQLILAHQKGFKIKEVTISHRPRKSVVSPPGKILFQIPKASFELIKFKFKNGKS